MEKYFIKEGTQPIAALSSCVIRYYKRKITLKKDLNNQVT